MIEFIPYYFRVLLPLTISVLTALLYVKSKKTGLMLVAVGFFSLAIPSMVSLALGGPYFALWLRDQGYTATEIGMFSFYLFLFHAAFEAVFDFSCSWFGQTGQMKESWCSPRWVFHDSIGFIERNVHKCNNIAMVLIYSNLLEHITREFFHYCFTSKIVIP